MRSRRGMVLLAALTAVMVVAALALAVGAEADARWRAVAQQRSRLMVRVATELAADSAVMLEAGAPCVQRADTATGSAPLLPQRSLMRIVVRTPRPGGGCRWSVEGQVLSADGLLFAAHRAVRRSGLP